MDKKKVKELTKQTIDFVENKYLLDALATLRLIEVELSKSDWVSVEDRLPPIGEAVRVRSKQHPNDFMLACRIDENTMKTIYPHKYYSCDVTHWKPIEKLEEQVWRG